MQIWDILIILLCISTLIISIISLLTIKKNNDNSKNNSDLENINQITNSVRKELTEQQSLLRQELNVQTQSSINNMGKMLSESQRNFSQSQTEKFTQLENRLQTFSVENRQELENIRKTVHTSLIQMQDDNNKQLEKMRVTVDEKLQKTLEEKMNNSFALVSQRLEEVYKGLGEMKNVADGVGDLKKVLSNVKTNGILGEIQLGAILTEILSPEQYETNVITKKGSRNYVEFAVKLPAEDDSFIYLPIDSKFPSTTYSALRDAIDEGDRQKIDIAVKQLITTIKSEAKDIRDKYIDPPNTTEFAIMFLPFEGLYSEVVNRGLVETLQRDYKINIAGPSTMAALLNSLQMGFKTLAVQKRSAEVWEVLSGVKKEFDTFGEALEKTQKRLEMAQNDLEKLVTTRTRAIQRKLKNVQTQNTLPEDIE
ncbi:MAG: DNA recombination protein RmuC [Ruminococcus sp.]|nr:DNA recombination protein RmuC [Ruminococcus sp.]